MYVSCIPVCYLFCFFSDSPALLCVPLAQRTNLLVPCSTLWLLLFSTTFSQLDSNFIPRNIGSLYIGGDTYTKTDRKASRIFCIALLQPVCVFVLLWGPDPCLFMLWPSCYCTCGCVEKGTLSFMVQNTQVHVDSFTSGCVQKCYTCNLHDTSSKILAALCHLEPKGLLVMLVVHVCASFVI